MPFDRERTDITDNVDLVAQRFQETGFSVVPNDERTGYLVSPTGESRQYGSFSIGHDGTQVMVTVNSGRMTGRELAGDMLRDAKVPGRIQY